MQHQIIRVNDIEQAIRENGLQYYVDRLIQDAWGNYFYVETDELLPDDELNGPGESGWRPGRALRINEDGEEYQASIRYRACVLPRDIAYFIIDALRLQAQVKGIGSGDYGQGPHGGRVKWFIKDGEEFKELPAKAFSVEEL